MTEVRNDGKFRTFTKTKYFDNGNIKEQYTKKTLQKVQNNENTVCDLYELYNKRGVLLGWTDNSVYPTDSTAEERDEKGRLVYNKNSNTRYGYSGKDTIPSEIVSERNGCKHKIVFENGEKKLDYYRARNGKVTTAAEMKRMKFKD